MKRALAPNRPCRPFRRKKLCYTVSPRLIPPRVLATYEEVYQATPAPRSGVLSAYRVLTDSTALEEVGGFDEELLHSEGWDLAYRLMRHEYKMRFAAKAQSYHLYHHHDFFSPQNAFAELQKRRRAITHIAEKNSDPKLYLIEFWLVSLWPDPLIPEEMRLPSLMAFHETYQTISSGEMAERALMLDLHPLRRDVSK